MIAKIRTYTISPNDDPRLINDDDGTFCFAHSVEEASEFCEKYFGAKMKKIDNCPTIRYEGRVEYDDGSIREIQISTVNTAYENFFVKSNAVDVENDDDE